MPTETDDELKARLNAETGKITWKELEPHFARGAVVTVAPGVDLVEVAVRLVRDDKTALAGWLDQGVVARTSSTEAERWRRDDETVLWAVVVAPWVLVQEAAVGG